MIPVLLYVCKVPDQDKKEGGGLKKVFVYEDVAERIAEGKLTNTERYSFSVR